MKKEWKSFQEMFEVMNQNVNYVILRNYEFLGREKLDKRHADLDILCDNKEELVSLTGAKPVDPTNNSVRYAVKINNRKIPMDIRELGDGYYDRHWQSAMLRKRRLFLESFYVMDEENYFYSLTYHALIQKAHVSSDYQKTLVTFAEKFDIHVHNVSELKPYLFHYMKQKKYFVTCSNSGIYINFKNIPPAFLRINPYFYLQAKIRKFKTYL